MEAASLLLRRLQVAGTLGTGSGLPSGAAVSMGRGRSNDGARRSDQGHHEQQEAPALVLELTFAHNKLSMLPSFLPLSLVLLDLSYNALEVLPDMRQLASLKKLNVCGNGLRTLLSLSFNTGLEAVNASRNRYGARSILPATLYRIHMHTHFHGPTEYTCTRHSMGSSALARSARGDAVSVWQTWCHWC